jgi:hypothetical protein
VAVPGAEGALAGGRGRPPGRARPRRGLDPRAVPGRLPGARGRRPPRPRRRGPHPPRPLPGAQDPGGVRLRPPALPQARGDRPPRHPRLRRRQGQRGPAWPARHWQDPPGHRPVGPRLPGRPPCRLRHRGAVGRPPRRGAPAGPAARRADPAGPLSPCRGRRGGLHPLRGRGRQPVLPAGLRPLRARQRDRHLQHARLREHQTGMLAAASASSRCSAMGSGRSSGRARVRRRSLGSPSRTISSAGRPRSAS